MIKPRFILNPKSLFSTFTVTIYYVMRAVMRGGQSVTQGYGLSLGSLYHK